ncbi:MAG TPA: hypothetical protein VLM83_03700, partial [Anaerolineales bacterium]|nr:hypothetical protein [Anaerolineales bacterium]
HYSYLTLLPGKLPDLRDAKKAARLLRTDALRVRETYRVSKAMIAQARTILERLEDRFLFRLVDVTELRLENYFRKELKFTE